MLCTIVQQCNKSLTHSVMISLSVTALLPLSGKLNKHTHLHLLIWFPSNHRSRADVYHLSLSEERSRAHNPWCCRLHISFLRYSYLKKKTIMRLTTLQFHREATTFRLNPPTNRRSSGWNQNKTPTFLPQLTKFVQAEAHFLGAFVYTGGALNTTDE